jgi:hypothetical protein
VCPQFHTRSNLLRTVYLFILYNCLIFVRIITKKMQLRTHNSIDQFTIFCTEVYVLRVCVLRWMLDTNVHTPPPRRNLKRHTCKPIWRPHNWASKELHANDARQPQVQDARRESVTGPKSSSAQHPLHTHPPTPGQ